jgi:hypothetical protein
MDNFLENFDVIVSDETVFLANDLKALTLFDPRKAKFVIPASVVATLNGKAKSNDPNERETARKEIAGINQLANLHIVSFAGKPEAENIELVLMNLLLRNYHKKNILFLSNRTDVFQPYLAFKPCFAAFGKRFEIASFDGKFIPLNYPEFASIMSLLTTQAEATEEKAPTTVVPSQPAISQTRGYEQASSMVPDEGKAAQETTPSGEQTKEEAIPETIVPAQIETSQKIVETTDGEETPNVSESEATQSKPSETQSTTQKETEVVGSETEKPKANDVHANPKDFDF